MQYAFRGYNLFLSRGYNNWLCRNGKHISRMTHAIEYLHAGQFCMFVCRLLIVFLHKILKKIFQENVLSECQTVWVQKRPDVLSGLIWIQTVCKDHQQTTKFAAGWQSFNTFLSSCISGYLGPYAKDHIQTFHRL